MGTPAAAQLPDNMHTVIHDALPALGRLLLCRHAAGGIPLHGIVPEKSISPKIAFSPNLLGGSGHCAAGKQRKLPGIPFPRRCRPCRR
jgi:hypothetical protein